MLAVSARSGGPRQIGASVAGCVSSTSGRRPEAAFYMLFIYSKAEQGDLTAAHTRLLGRLVREEFK